MRKEFVKMYITDDPIADFYRYDREQQKWLDRRPRCWACGEPIQEDTCLEFHEHKYHEGCRDGWAEDAAPFFREATDA